MMQCRVQAIFKYTISNNQNNHRKRIVASVRTTVYCRFKKEETFSEIYTKILTSHLFCLSKQKVSKHSSVLTMALPELLNTAKTFCLRDLSVQKHIFVAHAHYAHS